MDGVMNINYYDVVMHPKFRQGDLSNREVIIL